MSPCKSPCFMTTVDITIVVQRLPAVSWYPTWKVYLVVVVSSSVSLFFFFCNVARTMRWNKPTIVLAPVATPTRHLEFIRRKIIP